MDMVSGLNRISKKFKQLTNVMPKVDVLGPEIQHVPKKIQINKPMPDIKSITPKVDNEGLQIVHLPKESRVHIGTPKFDNLKARVDNKGIEILHGQSQIQSPIKTPTKIVFQEPIKELEEETAEDEKLIEEELGTLGQIDGNLTLTDPEERTTSVAPSISDDVFTLPQSIPSPRPLQTVTPAYLSSGVSRPSSTSSSSSAVSPRSQATIQRLFSLGSHHCPLSPRSMVPSPPEPSPSPKPRLVTPPDSPELILRPVFRPPAKVAPPTPPPSKLIQVSPAHGQDLCVQTDYVTKLDEVNQTEFEEPKKSGLKWWQYLVIILILLILFVGIGLAIGYGVGFFGKSKLRCNDGFVEVNNLCTAVSTTTTATPCDGCNCPMDITLDPDSTSGE